MYGWVAMGFVRAKAASPVTVSAGTGPLPTPFLLWSAAKHQIGVKIPAADVLNLVLPCTRVAYSCIEVLREGPSPAVLPRFRRFPTVFPKKRLELKSLKGQTKTEELGARGPELLSLRLSLKAL